MTATPLTDFLATLVDPRVLERFREDPRAVLAEAGMSQELVQLVLDGHPGAIRVQAVKELEKAGLAPVVSDKFGEAGEAAQQPMNISMNSYTTSTYTANTYTTNTFTNNTMTTTTTDTTTTTTNRPGLTDPPTMQVLHATMVFNSDVPVSEPILQSVDAAIAYFQRSKFANEGRLVIVGSGIRAIGDLTIDAEAQISTAQKVLYCVADPVIERRLHQMNPTAQSLYGLYGNDKPREQTYREMVEALLAPVRAGLKVCGVFYGHPGVFAWPTHEAVRVARREGLRAEMHPAVSADACLFADLGLDPSQPGVQSMEATDFLIAKRKPDVTSHFLLWQAECAGDLGFNFAGYRRHNFEILVERLQKYYPRSHPVVIYEAASLPQARPIIIKTTLDTIRKEQLTGISTLYLPPAERAKVNLKMCKRLGFA